LDSAIAQSEVWS